MSAASVCHAPATHPMWQESMAFVFCDAAARAVGTAAFGTFVNAGTGLTWLGCRVGGSDGVVFQRSRNALALTAADRGVDRLGVGSVHWQRSGPGRGCLLALDDGVEVRLEFEDLYPPTSWHDAPGGSLDALAAGHVECSARITGRIVVDDHHVEVEGWGHRDQSWGPRTTDIVRNHRWIAGTCGPALGFSAEALHLADGTLALMGFVARDGEVTRAQRVENLVTFDHDGLTPRAFEARLTLVTGEVVTIESREIHVCLYNHRDPLVAIDAIAGVRCGNLTGFADLNVIANPQAGTTPPSLFLGGTLEDGASPAPAVPTGE